MKSSCIDAPQLDGECHAVERQHVRRGAIIDAVVSYAEKHGVNNRTAAYMLALDRVAFAIKLSGIYA